MIQEIFPYKFDNHFKPGQIPADNDILFVFSHGQLLCRPEGESVRFVRCCDCKSLPSLIYLFSIDEQRFFLCRKEPLLLREDFTYCSIRSLRKNNPVQKHLIFAAITAWHLNEWYTSNQFCGRCGKATVPSQTERALVCPACGKIFYPRINPAVIVGVIYNESLLVTKYAGRDTSYYALVAGFTEIGESFEETVRREVMEEVGLEVTNIRYYKSQPWGFAEDILAGYFCNVSGSPSIKMDAHELKEAVWIPRKDVPGQPDDFSLTNEMMMAFKKGYRQ